MTAHVAVLPKSAVERSLGPIHLLLLVQTVDVILVSINRLSTWTTGYVAANEFLRWVDFLNMLVLPLISMIGFYLLKKRLEYDSPAREGRQHTSLNLIFMIALYLVAVSYGTHEVTNYLHVRFCLEDTTSPLCRIIIFNDDEFSHWVFFSGFILVNVALMFFQLLFPHHGSVTGRDWALLALNGLFIGAGIFANLAFEEIGLDLYVVAVLAILALGLLWRRGSQPLLIYYAIAYNLGLIATAIYKGVS